MFNDGTVVISIADFDRLREARKEFMDLKRQLRDSVTVVDSTEDIVTVDIDKLIEIAKEHSPAEIVRLLDFEGYALRRIN